MSRFQEDAERAVTEELNSVCEGHAITIVNERGFGMRIPCPEALDNEETQALAKRMITDLESPFLMVFAGFIQGSLGGDGSAMKYIDSFIEAMTLWTKRCEEIKP